MPTPAIYADFVNGIYQVNGETAVLSDMVEEFTGTGNYTGAIALDDDGLICSPAIGSPNVGSFPKLAAPALAAINANAPEFCWIIQFNTIYADGGADMGVSSFWKEIYTVPNSISLEQFTIDSTTFVRGPSDPSRVSTANGYAAPNAINQIAFNFRNGSLIEFSVNGAPTVSGSIIDQALGAWDTILIGPFSRAIGATNVDASRVQFLGAYTTAQPNLPALSTTGSRFGNAAGPTNVNAPTPTPLPCIPCCTTACPCEH